MKPPEQQHPLHQPAGPPRGGWERYLAAVLTLAGLAAAIVLGLLSEGVYHDDDITHYHFALDGWTDARAMLHWWGRPGYNLPTAVAAHFFGVTGCRIFSALQTAAVAWLAYCIARQIAGRGGDSGRWAALAPLLVWAQPLVLTPTQTFPLSSSERTQAVSSGFSGFSALSARPARGICGHPSRSASLNCRFNHSSCFSLVSAVSNSLSSSPCSRANTAAPSPASNTWGSRSITFLATDMG